MVWNTTWNQDWREKPRRDRTTSKLGSHLLDDLPGDPAFGQKQIEQCFFPQLQEWLDRDLRNADKSTVTSKGAVRDQGVDVGMPMRKLAESVWMHTIMPGVTSS